MFFSKYLKAIFYCLFIANLLFSVSLFGLEKQTSSPLQSDKLSPETSSLFWTCQYAAKRSFYHLRKQENFFANSALFALGFGFLNAHSLKRLQIHGEYGPLREQEKHKFNTQIQGLKLSVHYDLFPTQLDSSKQSSFWGLSLGLSYQDSLHKTLDSEWILVELAKSSSIDNSLVYWQTQLRTFEVFVGGIFLWKNNQLIKLSQESSYRRNEGVFIQALLSFPFYSRYRQEKHFADLNQEKSLIEDNNSTSLSGFSLLLSLSVYVGP